MTRFFLPKCEIHEKRGKIVGQELEHLRRVLRLRPGDPVIVFDDAGWEHEAVIQGYGDGYGEIEIMRSYQPRRESPTAITLAVGLTKGEKMDFVVEKATELGAFAIIPFVSSRTVPKPEGSKLHKRHERWRRIALSATKQSGRTRIPEILDLCDYPTLIGQSAVYALRLLCWEHETSQGFNSLRQQNPDAPAILLVIGPEGGFGGDEVSAAKQRGFYSVHLGHRILRAETAAVTALAVTQFLWGDLSL